MSERIYRLKYLMRDGVSFEVDTSEEGAAAILAMDFRARRQKKKSLVITARSGQTVVVNIAHVQTITISEAPRP